LSQHLPHTDKTYTWMDACMSTKTKGGHHRLRNVAHERDAQGLQAARAACACAGFVWTCAYIEGGRQLQM